MRLVRPFILFGGCVSLLASSATTAEPAANVKNQPYEVKFRFLELGEDGERVVGSPTIAVREHRRASFRVQEDRPFVVAVSPAEGDALEPTVEIVSTGRQIELACHSSVKGQVTLDVTIEETIIGDVRVKELDKQTSIQEPQIEIHKVRKFVTGPIGETLIVALDGKSPEKSKKWAEIVVARTEPR